jgi:cold shock CspA family protein
VSDLVGVVVAFDESAGLGEVHTNGGSLFPFHCTEIADGTRSIEVGTTVVFRRRAGRAGRWEAAGLRPC